MTDADDVGLGEALRLLANKGHISTNDADMLFKSARALSFQLREIEELRRELAEASKVAFIAGWNAVFSQHHDADIAFAASAFAAKHGGRDG